MTATVIRPRFSDTETRLLRELAAASGRLLSNEQLRIRIWRQGFVDQSACRVMIARTRKKLPSGTDIETVWGKGYRLVGKPLELED